MTIQTKVIYNYIFGNTRNIILGAGLYFAIEKKEYIHIPIIVAFPTIYAGYNLNKNKENIVKWIRNNL